MENEIFSDNAVYKSVKNRKWKKVEIDSNKALVISQKTSVPYILAELLADREINSNDVANYLNPKIRDFLPDPFHLLDMDKAVNAVSEAIYKQEKITIFGDYDVDGATSSALLFNILKALGADISVYIPDRIKEGYGPTSEAFKLLHSQGTKLIITVDCGISSFDPIALAKQQGVKVVVIDHHIGGSAMPDADAIINPNRIDEKSSLGYLAAVGVSFIFAVALLKKLRDQNHFQNSKEPNLMEMIDLVALGTVCDQVPLIGLNRAFVKQGLKVMNNRKNNGLKTLLEVANLANEALTPYHLGFVIGPRINAGGRVGESLLGANLLSHDKNELNMEIARKLNNYNDERKSLEFITLQEAIEEAEKIDKSSPLILVAKNGWHQGVIGIVASRLKDKYNKPVAVVAIENGVGKASCRSITGIDFGAAVISAKEEGILLAGGGHKMAAGFSIDPEKIVELSAYFDKKFKNDYRQILANNVSNFDGYISLASINTDFVNMLEQLGPFGTGSNQPRFLIKNVKIIKANIVGGEHISCFLGEGRESKTSIKAIAFKAIDNAIGEILLSNKNFNLNLIVTLNINRYNGRESAEIIIQDIIIE